MFDELNEGTAIFKVTHHRPRQGHFVTLDSLTSGWYLRLTGRGRGFCGRKAGSPGDSTYAVKAAKCGREGVGFETKSFRARCWKP
ncbi:MAG: hypothetical protein JWM59_983 [Verrucomicrobiales bacterium]|nr:hypothetical protein [Verrucomicrobiales bacterium]